MDTKIVAVVVTFNRLELLKKVIGALLNQTIPLMKIIVINNSSNDGTLEWLNNNNERLLIITQPNTGSSGGQYTGFKAASEIDCDYVWVMDDDVMAEKNCLEIMLQNKNEKSILLPMRYTKEGKKYINDTIKLNLTNPFKSIWTEIISEIYFNQKMIKVEGPTFEGPLFPINAIKKCGLPEKKFFIYGDDTEYFIRCKKNGFVSFIITDAKMQRMLEAPADMFEYNWKTYYYIRNIIAIDVLHCNFVVRTIRPFGYLFKWLTKCKTVKEIKITFNAFLDGYFYKSEN